MKLKVVKQIEKQFPRSSTNKELRAELKANFGISGRRLDNFTLSAMLTLAELKEELVGYDTLSLFSVANYFSLELLQKLVEEVSEGHELKPLDFVASVGNAANYYLAREFGINGSNIFAASGEQALSKGLTLAALELLELRTDAAVVMRWQESEEHRLCQALLCVPAEEGLPENGLAELEESSLSELETPYGLTF